MGQGRPPADAGDRLITELPETSRPSLTGERGARRLDPRLGDHGYHQLRQLARALRAEAERVPADALILDLGCGGKPYRCLFAGRYLGLDLSATDGSTPDMLGAAETLPVASASVDVVISTQQLEHVIDPGAVLNEARRVLASADGTLLLSTHGIWVHHPDPLDLWRWTEQGLVHLVEQHGFHIECVYRQGDVVTSALALIAAPLARATRHRNPLLRLPSRGLVAALNLAGYVGDALARRLLPRHYASMTYLVVATPA